MKKSPNKSVLSTQIFGERNRYNLVEFLDRNGSIVWFVIDAESFDKYGEPLIIRQNASREAALRDLQ